MKTLTFAILVTTTLISGPLSAMTVHLQDLKSDIKGMVGSSRHDVNISVHKDVVTLFGYVDDASRKYELETLALKTDGVSDVVNLLTTRR